LVSPFPVLEYETRPLTNRHEFPGKHAASLFKGSWSSTLDLLEREIRALRGRDVIIEVDVTDGSQIRNDGRLRADARVRTSAVRVVFESKHGPLQYATDVFPYWQDNVRAIALGLEALRRVDRYGIAKRGEQYTGWKQLGSGATAIGAAKMAPDEAVTVLLAAADVDEVGRLWENPKDNLDELYRLARIKSHPDRLEQDHTAWHQVEAAGRVLGLA
jgi:hypothetical protein